MGEKNPETPKPVGPDLPRRGQFGVKPPNYSNPDNGVARAGNQQGKLDAHRCQTVHVAHENRIEAKPQPDPQSFRITGRYQDEKQTFTFLINQAGNHIHCWKTEVLKASDYPAKLDKWMSQYAGDLQADDTYMLYEYPNKPQQRTTLKASIGRHREINLHLRVSSTDGEDETRLLIPLDLNVQRATISERVIKGWPMRSDLIGAYELAPLTRQRRHWLRDTALKRESINSHIQDFFDTGGGDREEGKNRRKHSAIILDTYIGKVFSTDDSSPSWPWHPLDLPLAKFYGRQILAVRRFEFEGAIHSQLDWIQIMLDKVERDGRTTSPALGNIRKYLALVADGDGDHKQPPHMYEIDLVVGGFGGDFGLFGVGGYVGTLTITKVTDPMSKPIELDILLGGISAGLGATITLGYSTHGKAETYADWIPEDFPGWVAIVDASATFPGASRSSTLMLIRGNDVHAPMVVDFSGWSTSITLGVSVATGGSWGHISYSMLERIKRRKDNDTRDLILRDEDYTIEAMHQDKIHFPKGDALLTPDGRQALRIMAAKELASLSNWGSSLLIIGHTDRVDCEKSNKELSELRAKNVKQALKDILAGQLMIPEDRIHTYGYGELGAAFIADDKDQTWNRDWRRVDVILNSRLVLRLTGK